MGLPPLHGHNPGTVTADVDGGDDLEQGLIGTFVGRKPPRTPRSQCLGFNVRDDKLAVCSHAFAQCVSGWLRNRFDNPDYIFELKHDGFRAIAYLQNAECKILSRNSNQLRFKSLRENLARLPAQDAIIDGEIACLDEQGVSQFDQLLSRKAEPILYAFDLLAGR